jgi:hypothetical protein
MPCAIHAWSGEVEAHVVTLEVGGVGVDTDVWLGVLVGMGVWVDVGVLEGVAVSSVADVEVGVGIGIEVLVGVGIGVVVDVGVNVEAGPMSSAVTVRGWTTTTVCASRSLSAVARLDTCADCLQPAS